MLYQIPLEQVDDNPFQTRTSYDPEALAELAADIERNDLLQPPVGRLIDAAGQALGPGAYVDPGTLAAVFAAADGINQRVQLAFGHRRLRAYRLLATGPDAAAWTEIPVELRRLTDQDMAIFAWSENAQRKDISPIEEAIAIQRMISAFGWTQEQAAAQLGIGRPTVANKLRLLRLPEEIQQRVNSGELKERQASALLPLMDMPEPLIERANKANDVWNAKRPADLIRQSDAMTSDQIREAVDAIVQVRTEVLGCDGDWPIDQPLATKAGRSDRCAPCMAHMVRDGQHRCADPVCFVAKRMAWRRQILAQYSQSSGISALDPANPMPDYGTYHDLAGDGALERLLAAEKRCPNLRLLYTANYASRTMPALDPDGCVRVICMSGKRDGACSCLGIESERAQRDAQTRANRAEVREIKGLAAAAVAAQLPDVMPDVLWYALLEAISQGAASKLTDRRSATIRGAVASLIVERAADWNSDNPIRLRHDLDLWLDTLGIPVPWTTPIAETVQYALNEARISNWYVNDAADIAARQRGIDHAWSAFQRALDAGEIDDGDLLILHGRLDVAWRALEEAAAAVADTDHNRYRDILKPETRAEALASATSPELHYAHAAAILACDVECAGIIAARLAELASPAQEIEA